MAQKHLVCQGAICQCQFGNAPDKLKVLTQTKAFINEEEPQEKLVATTADIGATFEKNTFGLCQMQPLPGGGYKPCQAMVTQWSGAYENITYEENNGHPLLEDSKATCPIGGKDCISIINHGQVAEITKQNIKNARREVVAVLCPLLDLDAPLIIDYYFTDTEGNKIEEAKEGNSVYLNIETENMIGKTVTIRLIDDDVDFEYEGNLLQDDTLTNYVIKSDYERILLKVVKQEKED